MVEARLTICGLWNTIASPASILVAIVSPRPIVVPAIDVILILLPAALRLPTL